MSHPQENLPSSDGERGSDRPAARRRGWGQPASASASRRHFYLSAADASDPSSDEETPADGLVADLFEDVSAAVRRLLGLGGHEQVGFYRFRAGVDPAGRPAVEEELGSCRVFVPLYSAPYFASDDCGLEMAAFMSRVELVPDLRPVPVAPLLWAGTPTSIPPLPAAPLTIDDRGEEVTPELYEVMTLRWYDDEALRRYHLIVEALSARIVELGRATAIPVVDNIRLDRLTSYFKRPPRRPHLGLYVLAPCRSRLPEGREADQYGPTTLEWNPFAAESAGGVVSHLTAIARNLAYDPVVLAFDDAEDLLFNSTWPAGPGVLVIDPWALEDPRWLGRLRQFDQLDKPWIGVVVVWDPHDRQTAGRRDQLLRRLDETLPRRFARRQAAVRLDADVAGTPGDLARCLSRVVQDAAFRYLRRAPGAGGHPTEKSP